MSICNPDNSGRSEPVPVEGSRFIIGADVSIQGTGEWPNLLLITELDGIVHGKRGNIIVDEESRMVLGLSFSIWMQ
jgi:NADPH-dependent glutamate synthase beta subunit-like oxidoreductase